MKAPILSKTILGCVEQLMTHIDVYRTTNEAGDWAQEVGITLLRRRQGKITDKTTANLLRRVLRKAELHDAAEYPSG